MPRKAVSQQADSDGARAPGPGPGPLLPLDEGADMGIAVNEANGAEADNEPAAGPGARKRAASAAPQPPQTIGAALRQARDAAGLTLEDVAARTKVRPGILREIEADAHEKLPALTYSLGFVKAYARTVGMDPAAAADRYRRESLKGDPVPTLVDLQPLEEKRLPNRNILVVATAGLVLALGLFWAWSAGLLNSMQPEASDTELAAGVAPVVVAAPPPGAVEVTPTVPPATSADAPVTLMAREDVWLRINDGNETFFMGTMAPGQVLTLPPGRAWLLRTGRAGALELKVGPTAIPPLGGPAEQVRNISLKPEDLLARASATGGLAPVPAG